MHLIALGIGSHLNTNELIQMTGSKDFVFQNLTNSKAVDNFVEAFSKLSAGEKCEFSRAGDGADIKCSADSVTITVTTKNRFFGHFYVENQFYNTDCRWRPNQPPRLVHMNAINQTSTGGVGQELSFQIGLDKCAFERQFSV